MRELDRWEKVVLKVQSITKGIILVALFIGLWYVLARIGNIYKCTATVVDVHNNIVTADADYDTYRFYGTGYKENDILYLYIDTNGTDDDPTDDKVVQAIVKED